MGRYKFRKAREGDTDAINLLYYRLTGRRRTPDQYAWEWLKGIEGEGERWVIYEEETDEIVGHHGLIPIRFNAWGTSLLAGKTENTMVAPEHRTKLIYHSYEKRMLEEAKKRFDLFFTTAGRGAPGLIRKRLGYDLVGYWATYLLHASPKYILSRLFSPGWTKTATFALSPLLFLGVGACGFLRSWRLNKTPRTRMIKARGFGEHREELDCFWEENRRYFGLTPERSGAYLEWRFQRNPYNAYWLYLFYEGEELHGYVVTRMGQVRAGEKVFKRMVIADMLAARNSPELYGAFLRGLAGEFQQFDLVVFRTLGGEGALSRMLAASQFFPWRNRAKGEAGGSPFYAHYHGFGSGVKEWFITEAVREGVIEP